MASVINNLKADVRQLAGTFYCIKQPQTDLSNFIWWCQPVMFPCHQ